MEEITMQKTQKINTPKRLDAAMVAFWGNSTRKQKIEVIPNFVGFFYGLCHSALDSVSEDEQDPALVGLRNALVQFLPELADMPL